MDVVCNTVQFRFPVEASSPSWAEIAQFTKELKSDLMQMEAIYRLPLGRSLCIKYKTKEAMVNSLKQNRHMLKFHYADGKVVDLHMCTAGKNVSYVRVFDLPPEIPDKDLALLLGEFGTVGTVVREKFPAGLGLDHLHTGVRGVYVDVQKEIPPSLQLNGWKARIFYDGLKNKCFSCNQEGHLRDSCPQRKTRTPMEMRKQNQASYAGVVQSGATALPEQVDLNEVIEVVQQGVVTQGVVQQEVEQQHEMEEESKEQQGKEEHEAEQRRIRKEQAMIELARFSNMVKNAVDKQQASERRAQFAASGSTEMSRPTKSARKK